MTTTKPTWPETAGQLNAENGGYDDGLEDAIAEALTDSLEMDWTTRDGARAVMPIVNAELAALRDRVKVLEEALTPSADTKAAYMSEFSFPVTMLHPRLGSDVRNIDVPWTTIKEIMATIRARAALKGGEDG